MTEDDFMHLTLWRYGMLVQDFDLADEEDVRRLVDYLNFHLRRSGAKWEASKTREKGLVLEAGEDEV